tara:strand:+ start:1400 stop:1663 length:264 start_codon:yes stop_codon:yes gene_type:complete
MASQSLFFKHSLHCPPSNSTKEVSPQMIDFKSNKRKTTTIDWDTVTKTKRPEWSKSHCDWHDLRLVNGQCSICNEIYNENGRRIENE